MGMANGGFVKDLRSRQILVALSSIVLGTSLAVSPVKAVCTSSPYADFILQSTTTTGVASRVLGAPDGLAVDFENNGNAPGFVTVGFNGDVIVDGPGVDFSIHLVDFAAPETIETFEVFVSQDGSSWVSLGTVQPTNPLQDKKEKRSFDLQPFGVSIVRQIKVVNLYADTLFTSEGPDLDAFQAVNCGSVAEVDLLECESDLDACQTELVTSDGELDECNEALDECASGDQALATCTSDLASCDQDLGACTSDLTNCDQQLGTCSSDLASREQELGACSSDLAGCDQELDTCSSGLASCDQQLGTCSSDLATRDQQLGACTSDLAGCDEAFDTCASNLASSNQQLGACTSDLASSNQQLGTCTSDLATREQQLGACSSGLATCEQQLGACSGDLASRDEQLAQYQGLLVQCDTALDAAESDLSEAAAGLAEIQRLVSLPQGQRTSSFTCSGSMCGQLTAVIQALCAPPGKGKGK